MEKVFNMAEARRGRRSRQGNGAGGLAVRPAGARARQEG